MRTDWYYAAPPLRPLNRPLFSFEALSIFDSMSAFVQLYPITPNDRIGPEDFVFFWHVEGFVESGEVMNGFFP